MLVVGGGQSPEVAAGYLNAYRILVSDLVLVIGGGASLAAIRELTDVPVLEARLRPRPAESVEGPVAVFTTAPADAREAIRSELTEQGLDVRHVSSNLADRDALRAELESVDAETILVELKAAAIDVVAEAAAERGARLVLLGSDVVAEGLDERLARARRRRRSRAGARVTSQPRHTEPLPLGGDGVPYSKGLMARALTAVGVPTMRAHDLARRVEEDLRARGETVADLDRIEELAEDDAAMGRLRRYFALRELDLPVIVLLGGATGTGKSTVATELAYRLGITRVTSTDFIRQTMRAFFSRDFMPSIHFSSFEAGEALREPEEADDPAIAGFLDQSRNVLAGVHASLDRALEEGWSMVLEGVHLVPGLVEPPPEAEQAVVARCILEIEDPAVHETHFYVRDASSDGVRPVARYLDRFDEIRRIQDELVTRARREDVAVIESANVDEAVMRVLDLVLAGAEQVERVP